MDAALIVFRQTVVMFLYMFAGYILFKTDKLTIKGSRDMATLLVWLVIPVVIINSFCVEYSREKLLDLVQSAFLCIVGIGLAMVIAQIIYKKSPIDNFGSAFSNAGFIGIPLVQAALGDKAVFYIVPVVAIMNMLQWSYGVKVITEEKSAVGIRHLILNPIFVGILIGLGIFVSGAGTHIPEIISGTLEGIAALNAPVAMIVMGSYLAQSDMKSLFTSKHLYGVSAVRLILIPLVTLLVFRLVPVKEDIFLTLYIALSTPIGANVAVYAQLYDADYPYACQTVALTTLLSIVTLPLMIMAASQIG